jgi:hypothetical protein
MQRVPLYNCTLRGMCIEHPDGVVAVTLFVPARVQAAEAIVSRVVRTTGYVDVTDLWRESKVPEAADDAGHPVADTSGDPTTRAEISALAWPALVELAEPLGVRAHGVKRAVVEGHVADALGIVEE